MTRWEIQLHHGRMGAPVRNARAAWEERAGLLLRAVDERGRVGVGEASPLPGYSSETLAQCQAALAALPPWDEPLTPAGIAALSRGVPLPAARCALEMALLDLLGQQRGQSLAALLCAEWPLAAARPPAGPVTVPLAALIQGQGAALVAAARAAGVTTVKVKIGEPGAFAEELRDLWALRDTLGDAIALRLDANGAFPLDEARARLAALMPLRPELIEEPVDLRALLPGGAERLGELAAVGVPLALDESLQDPRAEALIESTLVAALVLKPMALGLLRCRALASRAQAAGLGLIVTHLFDGPRALAAAQQLALSLAQDGATLLPCGLTPHAGLAAWPAA